VVEFDTPRLGAHVGSLLGQHGDQSVEIHPVVFCRFESGNHGAATSIREKNENVARITHAPFDAVSIGDWTSES